MPNRDIPHMILEIPHWIADFALHNFLPRTKLFSGSMVVDTQKKHRQSPIDIKSELVCCDPEQCKVDSLTIDYKERDCVSVTCSDGGWKVNVADNCTSTLTGSHLKDKYLLAQFHAHWSKDGSCGSEHTIDGKPTAAEVHFVFWNTKYANICEALEKEDGLAVVGVFIKEGKHNKAYQPLLEAIGDANKAPGKTASLPTNLSLQDLLPKPEDRDFVSYLGSLTTPPYNESVIWTLFTSPVEVSADQLNICREIVQANFRPCQDLCERKIVSSGALKA